MLSNLCSHAWSLSWSLNHLWQLAEWDTIVELLRWKLFFSVIFCLFAHDCLLHSDVKVLHTSVLFVKDIDSRYRYRECLLYCIITVIKVMLSLIKVFLSISTRLFCQPFLLPVECTLHILILPCIFIIVDICCQNIGSYPFKCWYLFLFFTVINLTMWCQFSCVLLIASKVWLLC